MTVRTAVVLLALIVCLSGVAMGQVLYGSLVGNVTDPQQGSIVGATISIKNQETGYATEAKTDSRGSYEIPNIPPGTYDVRIAAPGFSAYEAKQIAIQANNIALIDAPMKVGNVTETITVGAEVVSLQT